MKTKHSLIKWTARLTGISALIIAIGLAQAGTAQDKPVKPRERIGVYDSRAIAVAYAGSTYQNDKMKALKAQYTKAKEAGDQKEVARLEAEGQSWQASLHKQGFGTAPVDDLLAHIESELPKIQEAANVTGLVSKWNQAKLAEHPKAAQIDVTMQLVDAFHPNETQRKRAVEIQKTKPQN